MGTSAALKAKPFFLNLFGIFVAYVVWTATASIVNPTLNYLLFVPIVGELLGYPNGSMLVGAIILNAAPVFLASFVTNKITKSAPYKFANKAFCLYIILLSAFSMAYNSTYMAELCSAACAVKCLYDYDRG